MDFFEDDFVINDRANAMDPVLLIAAAKNKLVPIERRGVVRRRGDSHHDDEAEINESASPHKRRKLDDSLVDEKFTKSNRNEFNDILPALMGDGNDNGDGNGKRDDDKKNDTWNDNKSKSPKNLSNKENKNSTNDDDGEGGSQHGVPLSAILALRQFLVSYGNANSNNTNHLDADEDMPILVESDEDERPAQSNPIVIDDSEEENMPGLTSDEDSDDEDSSHGIYSPHHTCSVHGPRPTCCEYHAMNGFSCDEVDGDEPNFGGEEDYDDDEDYDNEDYDDDDDDLVMNGDNLFARLFGTTIRQHPINNQHARPSQPSSASSSLRQDSPFLRGGSSPVVPHLHGSNVPGRSRRRVDRDHEEYNEDYELDPHKPIDVPPLVWSDDESAYVFTERLTVLIVPC